MWKFQDFSATQILREINFGHFEASKTANLIIWSAMNFEFLDIFDIFKIQSLKIVKMAIFQPLKSAVIDFT